MMLRAFPVAFTVLFALCATAMAMPAGAEFDPAGFKSGQLRVIALERGPEGERVWLGLPGDPRRAAVAPGQVFADGHLLEVDWDEASVRIHVDKEDPYRRLVQPWRIDERGTFSTLQGAPFGDEGCPLFLARVEQDAAWVRTGDPGEESALGIDDELCGDWLVETLTTGGDEGRDLLTLKKGGRQLRLAASPP